MRRHYPEVGLRTLRRHGHRLRKRTRWQAFRAAASGGSGATDRPQRSHAHNHADRGEGVPHRQGCVGPRRVDRPARRHRGDEQQSHALSGAAPATAGLRAVHAARRDGGVPQGRSADRGTGRCVSRSGSGRGRCRLRRAHLQPAAGHRQRGSAVLLRTARGFCRRCCRQRCDLLRRRARTVAIDCWGIRAGRRRGGARRCCRPGGAGHVGPVGLP